MLCCEASDWKCAKNSDRRLAYAIFDSTDRRVQCDAIVNSKRKTRENLPKKHIEKFIKSCYFLLIASH